MSYRAEPFFFPSETIDEAIQRIYSLTGRSPDDSRGEKRALVALRDALGLDVDMVRTNAVLGRELARELHLEWNPTQHTERNKITLEGLNLLLEGAAEARRRGSLRRLRDSAPEELTGPAWVNFQPARSKIEAVTRMAALTDSPKEWLGPGSKEHKSVLINLADRIFPEVPLNRSSKTKLAAALARELHVPWTDKCQSTGETISLTGLNTILAGAERHLNRLGTEISDALQTPEDEGDALAAGLLAKMPPRWEGRLAVRWLAERGFRGANDNEWQGFYGEERAKIVLASAFSPGRHTPRVRYGNTTFDYALNYVWDIKVHTEVQILAQSERSGKNETLLNDERATRACIEDQGLGFLIISGAAEMDGTGEFVTWHRRFKAATGGTSAAPSNSGRSRTRKAAFVPLRIESFWVPNTDALEAAVLAGALKVRPIGRQAPRFAGGEGASRAHKFEMRMRQARTTVRVANYEWPTRHLASRPAESVEQHW